VGSDASYCTYEYVRISREGMRMGSEDFKGTCAELREHLDNSSLYQNRLRDELGTLRSEVRDVKILKFEKRSM
jgi:hypothetical protein